MFYLFTYSNSICDRIKEKRPIAGLAKIDFFLEMASTKLRYCLSKI